MGGKTVTIFLQTGDVIKIKKWKVKTGVLVSSGRVLCLYDKISSIIQEPHKLKCSHAGTVLKLLVKEGDVVNPGDKLLEIEECNHPTVMKDMCAECGEDLRRNENAAVNASVPMVHSIPDLKVSEEQAQIIGKADETRLLSDRKLVLLVDLDQTLIHTTNDNIPPNLKDVYHFQLYGTMSPWYHTRIRPGTYKFLQEISQFYELHICTFGTRNYAHTIAMFLDPDGKYFSHRILSRDECFNANSKTANLKALFPCGDDLVCIIDDREDVWNFASNLIHVKPYHFFQHTGDINAPPELAKTENDDRDGFDFTKIDIGSDQIEKKKTTPNKKVELLGDTTTDKDTDDDNDDVTDKTKQEVQKKMEIEEVSHDLELSEDDSQESNEKVESSSKEDKVTEEISEKNEAGDEGVENKVEEPQEELENGKEEKISQSSEEQENKTEKEENKDMIQIDKLEDELIEVEDGDDYLLYLEDILKNIYKEYYKQYDEREDVSIIPALKTVIPAVKSSILKGCSLVFSGVIPTHVPLEESRAYLVAISLGANVTNDLTPNTTHLVAARPGTVKVNSARRQKGVVLVTPLWLWHCAERWERLDERVYPLGRSGVANRHPPAHCGSPEHNSSGGFEEYVPAPKSKTLGGFVDEYVPAPRNRSPSGRFIDTINPLLTFSSEDIKIMDQEVDELFDDDDESESDEGNGRTKTSPKQLNYDESSSSSSTYSLSGAAHPRGWKENSFETQKRKLADTTTCTESDIEEESPSVKFRRGEVPSELELNEDDSEGDWNMMGAALEREFLSEN